MKTLNCVGRESEDESNLYLVKVPLDTLFAETFSSWTILRRLVQVWLDKDEWCMVMQQQGSQKRADKRCQPRILT
jgi:hypothetical protein